MINDIVCAKIFTNEVKKCLFSIQSHTTGKGHQDNYQLIVCDD